jgi:hypothetical protein
MQQVCLAGFGVFTAAGRVTAKMERQSATISAQREQFASTEEA